MSVQVSISRRSRVYANMVVESVPELARQVRANEVALLDDGDMVTTRETTPQGHSLVSHFLVRGSVLRQISADLTVRHCPTCTC